MWILLLQYSILYLMRIRRIYNSPAPSFLGWTGEFRNLIRIIQFIEFTSYSQKTSVNVWLFHNK